MMKKYITKQSSIKGAGKGLFTNAFFKKGEVIGLAHVDDQPASEIGRNHNHNEKNPTAYSKKINNKRFIYASRNLKPGEEITTNYRMQPELEQPEDFMRKGGALLTKKVTCKKCGWKWDAKDGGNDITTCHKCGGQGLVHAQDGGLHKFVGGGLQDFSPCQPDEYWDGEKCVKRKINYYNADEDLTKNAEYQDWLIRQALWEYSDLPYNKQDYLYGNIIKQTKNYNNQQPYDFQTQISDFKKEYPETEDWEKDVNIGPYGSQAKFIESLTNDEVAKHSYRIIKDKNDMVNQDINKNIDGYKPFDKSNVFFNKYPPSSWSYRGILTSDPIIEKFSGNWKGDDYVYKKPNTLPIEDNVDRAYLKKFYPKLTDEQINMMVKENQENPSYITNQKIKEQHIYIPGRVDGNDIGKGQAILKNEDGLTGYKADDINTYIRQSNNYTPSWAEPKDLWLKKEEKIENLPILKPSLITTKCKTNEYWNEELQECVEIDMTQFEDAKEPVEEENEIENEEEGVTQGYGNGQLKSGKYRSIDWNGIQIPYKLPGWKFRRPQHWDRGLINTKLKGKQRYINLPKIRTRNKLTVSFKKQDGGNTDAMNGMMKARLAYANEFGNPAAKRMINLPDNPYQFDNGDTGTHYMASYDNYAVPQIQDENGVLQLGDYGPESNEAIRFDSDEDANYFAENYKDVSPSFLNEKQYGGLNKFVDGGKVCPKGEYWNGKKCVKLPKNAFVTSDLKKYIQRKAAYDDSLNHYKAYLFQDRLTPGHYKINNYVFKYETGKDKGWATEKAMFDDITGLGPCPDDRPDCWDKEKKLIKYYKSLGFTDKDIQYHTTPDIVTNRMKSSGAYSDYDGGFRNPIYKKPVQEVIFDEPQKIIKEKKIIKPTTRTVYVDCPSGSVSNGQIKDVTTPDPESPGNYLRTITTGCELEKIENLPILKPGLIEQEDSELQGADEYNEALENLEAPFYQPVESYNRRFGKKGSYEGIWLPSLSQWTPWFKENKGRKHPIVKLGMKASTMKDPITGETVNKQFRKDRKIQRETELDRAYYEGSYNEKGKYIPGEIENAERENRRVNFKGQYGRKDKKAQEQYNLEYDEYEFRKKFPTLLDKLNITYEDYIKKYVPKKQYGGISNDYIEADLDEDEIEEYKRGGYIVEEIDTYQNGGSTKLKYKKPQGASVQPSIQKIIKNPSAALKWSKEQDAKDLIKKEKIEKQKALEKAKNALIYNEIKKLEDFETLEANELKKLEHLQFTPDKYVIPGSFSNSYNPSNNIPISDNTNIYRQPIVTDWRFNPKYQDNLGLFVAKQRFEDAKAKIRKENDSYLKEGPVNHDGTVETVGQFNKRQSDWEHSSYLNKLFTEEPENNYWFKPSSDNGPGEFITGFGAPKMVLQAGKWLKPLWNTTKTAWKAPIPLGRTITNATAGTVTPRNLLFSYWAAESANNQVDPNSDVVKSQSNFINNPSWNTLGDAAFETGVNSFGFSGLGLGKQVIKPVYNASKNLIKGYKKVPKQLPGSPNSINQSVIPTQSLISKFNNKIDNGAAILEQAFGKILKDKSNKKAVNEGNEWLNNWINNPITQKKIDFDWKPYNSRTNFLKDELDLGYEQAKTFVPASKEYPLSNQFKELIKGRDNIHIDNKGVSYIHSDNPLFRIDLDPFSYKDIKKFPRTAGSWISRNPFMSQTQRASTTVHEGVHDWVTDFLLKNSGQKDNILKTLEPSSFEKLVKWKNKEKLSKEDEYIGYLANPTEVHARIMQLRKQFDMTPEESVQITSEIAQKIMNTVKRLPKKEQVVDPKFFDIIGNDPEKLAFLFRRLWGVVPVAGTAGLLNSKEKKHGGATNNYVEAELTLKEIKDLIAQGYVIEELN